MADKPQAATTETPVETTEQITGLPTQQEPIPLQTTGTVAELLSLSRSKRGEEKKKAEGEPTAEEKKSAEEKLKAVDEKLRAGIFGKRKKKEEDEEPKEEDTKQQPEEKVEDPKPEKPAPVKKKVTPPDRQADLQKQMADLERQRLELERQRLEFERERSKPAQPQRTPAEPPQLSLLSPDERYEYEVYQEMSKDAKHADLPKRFLDVAEATAKYKARWEKENPGETFNPDDSDHDAFFAKNNIKYDKKEFRKAELRIATAGESDPKLKELERESRELKAQNKLRELEPRIINVFAQNVERLIESVDPEMAKVAKEKGRAGLSENYPDEAQEIFQAAGAIEALSVEAHRILESDGLYAPEDANPIHGNIIRIIRHQEKLIPAQPRENRLDPEGRDFATWEQWVQMSPQEQANYWHLGAPEVVEIATQTISAKIKDQFERINRIAERRFKRTTRPETEETEEETRPVTKTKAPAASPGSASKSIIDTTKKRTTTGDDDFGKRISSVLFRKAS